MILLQRKFIGVVVHMLHKVFHYVRPT